MEDFFGFPRDCKWETIRKTYDLYSSSEELSSDEENSTKNCIIDTRLTRNDVICFGSTPTEYGGPEYKIYRKCDKCDKIINPRRLLVHKQSYCHNVKDEHLLATNETPNLINSKKSRSVNSSKKKPVNDIKLNKTCSAAVTLNHFNTHTLANTIDSNLVQEASSTSKSLIDNAKGSSLDVKASVNKSRKTSKLQSEHHSGVNKGHNGHNTRSVVAVNNHKNQSRKPTSTRQKQKEKDSKQQQQQQSVLKSSINQTKIEETFCENTSYVPTVTTIANTVETSTTTITYVPIKLKTETDSTRQTTSINSTTTDCSITDKLQSDDSCFISNSTSQECAIAVGKPISIVTIQSQSVFIPIPDTSDIKMYEASPKPVAVPNFGLKKIDSAIIFRLARQRSDILKAIDTIRNTNTSNNNNNKAVEKKLQPNVLKVTNRVNCKRSASEILTPSDNSKQKRLDANGFIFHADKSPTYDTVICPNI